MVKTHRVLAAKKEETPIYMFMQYVDINYRFNMI